MKKRILLIFLAAFCLNGFCSTFIISNSGLTFSPSTITITQNDNINFSLASNHNAIEVSLATWNANGITPVIATLANFGGGPILVSPLSVGTHYYVCQNHGPMGMKGIIIVQSAAAVPETKIQENLLIYPSPVKDHLTIQYTSSESTVVEFKLYNLQGKLIKVLLPKTEVTGLFERTFQLNNVTTGPGVYLIQIATGDNTAYRKVIVI
jgi:plastocyanin